jgi:hypothetical protein
MDEAPRRFARHEDELAALLEKDIRGAEQRGFARAGGDPPEGAHRAGTTTMASKRAEPLTNGTFIVLSAC